jgi:hypothetical protein
LTEEVPALASQLARNVDMRFSLALSCRYEE